MQAGSKVKGCRRRPKPIFETRLIYQRILFMRIAIVGCGNMGKALAERLSKVNSIFLYDRNIEKTERLAQEGYGKACKNLKDALPSAELIILAVKPQNLKQIADEMKDDLQENQILVSLLAGTPIQTLNSYFPNLQILRVMPNLPLIYGEGVIGVSSGEKMKKGDKDLLTKIFEVLGKVYWLPEEKIDALTALAGSGPAFFLVLVEAMIDAGISMGFSVKDARELVIQMLKGSLTLLDKTGKHPGELKWQIASPQGTTIVGLQRLEELALRGGIMNTFLSTYNHAVKLSSHSKKDLYTQSN